MFLYDILVAIVPFTQATYDSGYYWYVNQHSIKDYLESFVISKESK